MAGGLTTTSSYIFFKFTKPVLLSFICRVQNVSDQIYEAVRDMQRETGAKTLKYADVMEYCVSKGFKPDRIDSVIEEYEELNVWQVNQAHTKITFV